MTFMRMAAALVVAILGAGTLADAHHSHTAAYDESKRVEVQGTITRLLLRNPHSWVFVESTDGTGQKTEWQIEMGSVLSLGWAKEALQIGRMVKVVGCPSRAEGSHGMVTPTFTATDGTPLGPPGACQGAAK